MKPHKFNWWWLLPLAIAWALFGAAKPVHAATFTAGQSSAGTYEVPYTVLKAGTTSQSVANSFFSGSATVVVGADGYTDSVTLHIIKNANTIAAFAIGDQAATVTNATKDSEDLTFKVDDGYTKATVGASMTIAVASLKMKQQADIQFATPLYAIPTKEVPYQIHKADSSANSLANSFFTGSATVTTQPGGSQTVTLHIQKYANMIQDFMIGTQAATVTNATKDTEDLTFKVDDTFATPTVRASMTIAIMHKTEPADIVFASALYTAPATTDPGTTTTTPDDPTTGTKPATKPTTKPTTSTTKPATATKPTAKPVKLAPNTASVAIYQSVNGRLSTTPSAAGGYIAKVAKVHTNANGTTTLVLHTTGADYIDAMTLLGHKGKLSNRHGNDADLTFTLPTSSLKTALPAVFKLTVPGGIKMTEAAYVLIGLPISQAKVTTKTPTAAALTATTQPLVAKTGSGHAIDATKATQSVTYTVLNQSKTGASNANSYFTHSARVVKTGSGYAVTLTVSAPAGVVSFTPRTVNGRGVTNVTHHTAGGQDVWSYTFTVANASGLDQPIPATIELSVPMAGIENTTFTVWLVFNHGAGATTTAATTSNSAKAKALASKTIKILPNATTNVVAAAPVTAALAPLPQLEPTHAKAEIAGFALAGLAIMSFAWFRRRHLEKNNA